MRVSSLRVQIVLTVLLFGALAVWLGPESRNDSHFWRMIGAGLGALAVAVRVFAARRGWKVGGVVVKLGLAAGVVLGVFNYFQFDRAVFESFGEPTDITYYYLNSKYLDELGYFGLYAAVMQADTEHKKRHVEHVAMYRDLRDYELKPMRIGLEHGKTLRDEHFSEARWEAFKSDNDFFFRRFPRKAVTSNYLVDHGYNPPPTWAVLGALLSNAADVEHVHWITQVDTLVVIGMFAAIAWAFGWEAAGWAALFFVVTFSGRWPVLGQSLNRFDWLASLVGAVCLAKRGWHGSAGALLAYSAMSRVFPAIFFLPWVAGAVVRWVQQGRPAGADLRGAGGALSAVVVLGTAAFLMFGPATFRDSIHNLSMHNQSYSSHRVGLGDMAVYRGERSRQDIAKGGGIAPKEAQVQRMQPALRGIGVLLALFIVGVLWRCKVPVHVAIPLAILPLFAMTNPQINYYNLRILLVIWHATRLREHPVHGVGLAWLFGLEVVTQGLHVSGAERYLTTTATSYLLGVYLLGLIGLMARSAMHPDRSFLGGRSEPKPA
jgi:hypothetical protein